METAAQQTWQRKTIDVSGLSDEAVRAVELLVTELRRHQPVPVAQRGMGSFASYEEWSRAFREWVASHKPLGTSADYSLESIYADDRDE
jgi:hypothetical protein